MKIPKVLKIAGLVWNVKKSLDVTHEGSCYGSTHHSYQNIFLDPTTTKQKNEQTFIHEILHAVWSAYGLKEFKAAKEFEEQILDSLSNGLYQVLNDNNLLK